MYQLHVKGFTARANSGVASERRGTFLGLVDKIPYLKELGVTVVELLPVQQFDPQEKNYWGYMTLNFFAPHRGYGVRQPVREFREMVRAFHEAGIEVWLDVVYNHTAEGWEGPRTPCAEWTTQATICCSLTASTAMTAVAATPRAAPIQLPALWCCVACATGLKNMHVDGFRFDLASVFARDAQGNVDTGMPALVHEIGAVAAQLDVRLIAEAWDIGVYCWGEASPG